MGIATKGERRLLSENEYEPLVRSHYPALQLLEHRELVELARWLRSQRARAQDIIRDRRRVRRGKADPRSQADETASERGLAAKKQVFAHALKRVNTRLHQLNATAKRARNVERLHAALQRKRSAPVHHPRSGPSAGTGMRSNENKGGMSTIDPSRIGQVSQSVRDAQARRDGRDR
jgi:hypothetical protein